MPRALGGSGSGSSFTDVLATTVTDSSTNSVTDVLQLTHLSTGTPAAGFGTGILFQGEDDGGNTDTLGEVLFEYTDATAGSEDTDYVVKARALGAASAEIWRVTGLGRGKLAATSALTNTVADVLTLDHRTSGMAAASFGSAILFTAEDAGGNADDLGREGFRWSDATAASEDSDWFVQLRVAGAALADRLTLTSLGVLSIPLRVVSGGGAALGAYPFEAVTSLPDGRYASRSTDTSGVSGLFGSNNNGSADIGAFITGTAYGTALLGNSGTASSHAYLRVAGSTGLHIGTSNAQDVTLSTNNIERVKCDTDAEGAKVTAFYVSENSVFKRVTIGATAGAGPGAGAADVGMYCLQVA